MQPEICEFPTPLFSEELGPSNNAEHNINKLEKKVGAVW